MSNENDVEKIAEYLFVVKKNQLKLLKKRGYDINKEKHLLSMTLQDFLNAYIPHARKHKKSFRSILTHMYNNNDYKKILVYYADVPNTSSQLGVEAVGHAIEMMTKYKVNDSIIITPKNLSASASKHISGLVSYNIQVFLEEEMSYNPLDHILTPEHIPLTPEEQKLFLTQNNLTIDQIPKILITDVIIMYLGLRNGQIVKINRYNTFQTSILESTSYRVVVIE